MGEGTGSHAEDVTYMQLICTICVYTKYTWTKKCMFGCGIKSGIEYSVLH